MFIIIKTFITAEDIDTLSCSFQLWTCKTEGSLPSLGSLPMLYNFYFLRTTYTHYKLIFCLFVSSGYFVYIMFQHIFSKIVFPPYFVLQEQSISAVITSVANMIPQVGFVFLHPFKRVVLKYIIYSCKFVTLGVLVLSFPTGAKQFQYWIIVDSLNVFESDLGCVW